MPEPLSLLAAAKKVAEFAELEWAHVQPYYRALQEPDGEGHDVWLPKSIGRNIWAAHPTFIAPLLIALATAGHPARSNAAMAWVVRLTPNGRPMNLDELPAAYIQAPVLKEFVRYLSDPEAARGLRHIRFEPTDLQVLFTPYSGEPTIFRFHISLDKAPGNMRPRAPGISTEGRIEGHVIARIAENIAWRSTDTPFAMPVTL